MTAILIAAAVFWIACGVEAYARTFAFFDREWPALAEEWRVRHIILAVMMGVIGPFGVAGVWLLFGFKHGRKWS